MHPLELMRKHQWDYLRLACEMGITEAAVRKWAMNPKARNFRNPSSTAFVLAAKLDKEYSAITAA